jgi:hypothetical protein
LDRIGNRYHYPALQIQGYFFKLLVELEQILMQITEGGTKNRWTLGVDNRFGCCGLQLAQGLRDAGLHLVHSRNPAVAMGFMAGAQVLGQQLGVILDHLQGSLILPIGSGLALLGSSKQPYGSPDKWIFAGHGWITSRRKGNKKPAEGSIAPGGFGMKQQVWTRIRRLWPPQSSSA